MPDLPSGTVTFLFTDIEGSTALWERDPAAMRRAVDRHLTLLDEAIASHGGVHFKTIGDAIQAAFPTTPAALAAALAAQRALVSESWPDTGPLRVRMALHVGEATPVAGDYLASALNRLSRLLGAGHGGQILLTAAAALLARPLLPPQTALHVLGVHRLRDLLEPERVYQLLHPDLPAEFPPLRSLDVQPNNLPSQPNAFFGRERELAEVVGLLRDARVRLLTLTGPGGTGKTRLAVLAAAELLETFPDGVYVVQLAALTDANLVPATIAATLAMPESPGQTPREQVLAALASKQMLLVLDNLEQIPGAAPFIGELLAAAPDLSVLATSRAPLRLRAEREYPVSPLPLPPRDSSLSAEELARFDAVRLFVDRAQAVRPGFTLDSEDAVAVGEIIRRLDGLPLAIELAAARVRLFRPHAMLARLEQRLPLLTDGARDLPARQRALRETIVWSYDLLAPEEQSLFQHLALFSGGFTLDAAEAVAAPGQELVVLDGVERLVAHSLLQPVDAGDPPRFRMLETIREYGLDRLTESGEADTARARHAAFFLELAEAAAAALDGPDQASWLARLEAEHDNLRASLGWLHDRGNGAESLRLAAALWPFWDACGHYTEGRAWLERVLAGGAAAPKAALAAVLTGAGSIARMQSDADRASELLERALAVWQELGEHERAARVLLLLGHVADRQGDFPTAETRFTEALAIGREIDDLALRGAALGNLGIVADERGEYALATERYQEALAIFRQLGDRRREAASLDNLGVVARAQGELATAARYYEEALTVRHEVGDAWGIASTVGNLGVVAHQRGDLEQARHYYEESLAGFRALGDRRALASTLVNLGVAARQVGDLPRAATLHREGLDLAWAIGDRVGVVIQLEGIAAAAVAATVAERAARLFGATEALRQAIGSARPPDDQPDHDRSIAAAQSQLGDARFTEAFQEGQTLALEQVVSEALSLAGDIAQPPVSTRP